MWLSTESMNKIWIHLGGFSLARWVVNKNCSGGWSVIKFEQTHASWNFALVKVHMIHKKLKMSFLWLWHKRNITSKGEGSKNWIVTCDLELRSREFIKIPTLACPIGHTSKIDLYNAVHCSFCPKISSKLTHKNWTFMQLGSEIERLKVRKFKC